MKFVRHGRAVFFISTIIVLSIAGFFMRNAVYQWLGAFVDKAVQYGYSFVARRRMHELYGKLYKENQELKAALSALEPLKKENEKLKSFFDAHSKDGSSFIYARTLFDPFNSVKNYIAVSAGAETGIREGAVAVWTPNIFFGEVRAVYREYSIVKTIFDEAIKVPVRVGDHQVPALFQGGATPRLDFIAKDASVKVGDSIVMVSGRATQYPDLFLGTVLEVYNSGGELFQQATIRVPYAIEEVGEVFIRKEQ